MFLCFALLFLSDCFFYNCAPTTSQNQKRLRGTNISFAHCSSWVANWEWEVERKTPFSPIAVWKSRTVLLLTLDSTYIPHSIVLFQDCSKCTLFGQLKSKFVVVKRNKYWEKNLSFMWFVESKSGERRSIERKKTRMKRHFLRSFERETGEEKSLSPSTKDSGFPSQSSSLEVALTKAVRKGTHKSMHEQHKPMLQPWSLGKFWHSEMHLLQSSTIKIVLVLVCAVGAQKSWTHTN